MLALDPIIHESFRSPKRNSNDIALLKLAEDVDLTIYTPACLPAPGTDYTGQNGRVYGGRYPIIIVFQIRDFQRWQYFLNLPIQVGEAQHPVLFRVPMS